MITTAVVDLVVKIITDVVTTTRIDDVPERAEASEEVTVHHEHRRLHGTRHLASVRIAERKKTEDK